MSWWTQRQNDARIDTKLEVLNWNELKACMRTKFVMPTYEKNKKFKEEIKELVQNGRKFVDGENNF